jgi:hypothetical protein
LQTAREYMRKTVLPGDPAMRLRARLRDLRYEVVRVGSLL